MSPGSAHGEARVATDCPTLAWTQVPTAREYRLRVFAAAAAEPADLGPARLSLALPAGIGAWAPALDQCLGEAGRFAWVVGAVGPDGTVAWSEPGLFRVEGTVVGASGPHFAVLAGADSAPRAQVGEAFSPSSCIGVFSDVGTGDPFCEWIEKLSADRLARACAAGRYCPDHPVTRAQLAQALEQAMRGTDGFLPEQGDGAAAPPPAGPQAADLDPSKSLFTSVTVGSDGLGLVAYYDFSGGDLMVAHCSDLACSDATISTLDSAGDVGEHTSIAIGRDGLGLISYLDGANHDLKVAHCTNVACTAAVTHAVDTAGLVAGHTSIAIGADGRGLVSYVDGSGDVAVAHCADTACTSVTKATVDADATALRTSIALGVDGRALIAYNANAVSHLKVARCSNLDCSTVGAPVHLEPGVESTHSISLAIGADGRGLIAYVVGDDTARRQLRIAHCNDRPCSSAAPGFTAAAPEGGDAAAIIGPDGLGLVAFEFTDTQPRLGFAHCSDAVCSSATIAALERAASHLSMTSGSDGLPLLAYQNGQNGLSAAHCPNLFCAPFLRR